VDILVQVMAGMLIAATIFGIVRYRPKLSLHLSGGWGAILFFVILGAMSLIALTMPQMVIYGVLFGILPGLLLALSVPTFIYSFLVYVLWALAGRRSLLMRISFTACGLLAFAIATPWVMNRSALIKLAEIKADDIFLAKPLERTETVVLLTNNPGRVGQRQNCDAICQRLLLTRTSAKVWVGDSHWIDSFDPNQMMVGYWLERRQGCSSITLDEVGLWDIERGSPHAENLSVTSALKQLAAQGTCVVAAQAAVGKPDLVIAKTVVNTWHPSLSASRIEAFERDGSSYRALFRQSHVSGEKIWIPFVVVSKVRMHPMEAGAEIARVPIDAPAPTDMQVYHSGLKLPLTRRSAAQSSEYRNLIRSGLNDSVAKADDQRLALASDWLSYMTRSHTIDPEDVEVLTILVRDPRITSLSGLNNLVGRHRPQDHRLSEAMLSRLQVELNRNNAIALDYALSVSHPESLMPNMDALRSAALTVGRGDILPRATTRLPSETVNDINFLMGIATAGLAARRDVAVKLRHETRVGMNALGALQALCASATRHPEIAPILLDQLRLEVSESMHGWPRTLLLQTVVRAGAGDRVKSELGADPEVQRSVDDITKGMKSNAAEHGCRW
jgi:hypothetical protein